MTPVPDAHLVAGRRSSPALSRVGTPHGDVQVGARRNPYARWRAATLLLVHLLIAAHIVHWKLAGKTLAPLELNEVMYTLELGIVTAGFLFMAGTVLATLIFGRFFCSWGCHILALQDLCHWILGMLRIRPRPIRSRALVLVPVAAALYMFVWPQVSRALEGRPLPVLHWRTDTEGWASLTTQNFWRNLPGPGIALLTFAVCGFLIVYVLGSRGFCAYGCPYGAVFRLADRFATGRIRFKGVDCSRCGACTAVCGSHIRVHEELNRFGMVASAACLKDLDCVAACPEERVYFGFGRPSILKKVINRTPIRKRTDFSYREELFLVAAFLATLFIYRGLYDRVPFLLSLGLGGIAAFLAVQWLRMLRRSDMQWNRITLKSRNRLTLAGYACTGMMASFLAFSVHSAIVRFHTFQGRRLAQVVLDGSWDNETATRAIEHLNELESWSWFPAERDHSLRAALHYRLAGDDYHAGNLDNAERRLRAALLSDPRSTEALYDLGAILVETGRLAQGIECLRAVVAARPEFAEAHYNLALAFWMDGNTSDARREIETAYRLKPADDQIQSLYEVMKDQPPS